MNCRLFADELRVHSCNMGHLVHPWMQASAFWGGGGGGLLGYEKEGGKSCSSAGGQGVP